MDEVLSELRDHWAGGCGSAWSAGTAEVRHPLLRCGSIRPPPLKDSSCLPCPPVPAAGLNCGRWDYMFSFVKTLRSDPTRIFPDRALVGMDQPFLRAYTQVRAACLIVCVGWGSLPGRWLVGMDQPCLRAYTQVA